MGLKPEEFYRLTPGELDKMVKAYSKNRMNKLWERAYFVAEIINNCRNVKETTKLEKLMKPFLPEKTAEEIKAEREAFFKDFYKQRKEEEDCGNHSKPVS